MRYAFWFLLFLILYAQWSSSADLAPHLEELSVDYALYKNDSREPVLYPDPPKERLDLNMNMSFLKWGYTKNTVHSLTDASQFRLVGWHYQLGVHVGPWFDVYGEHFSQHVLDKAYGKETPVENMVGIKIYLYRRAP